MKTNLKMKSKKIKTFPIIGLGNSNPGLQSHGDERRGRGRDQDEREGKSVLLVSELNSEVLYNF